MKNLPEKDFWKDVGNRLKAYNEEPDDDSWDKIAGALLPPQPPKGLVWIDRFAGLALLIYLSFMVGYSVGRKDLVSMQDRDDAVSQGVETRSADVKNSEEERSPDQPVNETYSNALSNDQSVKGGNDTANALAQKPGGQYSQLHTETPAAGGSASRRSAYRKESNANESDLQDAPVNHTIRSTNGRSGNSSDEEKLLAKANAQSRNGGNDHTNTLDQKSDQQYSRLRTETPAGEPASSQSVDRKGSNTQESDFPNAPVDHKSRTNGSSNSSSKGGEEEKLLAKANVSSSVAEENSSTDLSGTQAQVNKDKLHSGSNVASDSVIDSIAVDEIAKTNSAVKKAPVESKKPAKKKQRIHPLLYFALTPSLSFQKITPEQTDAVTVKGMQSPGVLSSRRFGLSFEAGFQRQLTKHLEAYGGISYYQQRQQLTYEYQSDKVDVISSVNGGYTIKPQTTTKDFKYNMLNAGISAGMFYRIKGDKLMHKVGAGVQYQKGLLRAGSEDTYNNSGSSYFNYQILYRVEYLLNPKVNIFVQPSFTHSFYVKEELAEPFTIKPYRAGIGLGMIYHF